MGSLTSEKIATPINFPDEEWQTVTPQPIFSSQSTMDSADELARRYISDHKIRIEESQGTYS